MREINWLHLSDLHFGLERENDDIETIRDRLLDYVRKEFDGEIKFDYLFVTGDIFYGKNFFNDKYQREEYIKNATEFFDTLISNIDIDRKNVFIVPGNHDTNRKGKNKEEYINEIRHDYNMSKKVFDESIIEEYQKEFNEFCAGLKINYCDKAHKLVKRDDADILMLNTSISSCKSEEKADLLLGKPLFREELDEIKDAKTNNWENESRPLFILAHHNQEFFIDADRKIIEAELSGKKDSVLYLCGHNHLADVKTIDGIHVLICGTDVEKDKIGDVASKDGEQKSNTAIYKKNEVNFLRGSFDTDLEKTTIYFYKWCRDMWMENRDLRQKKHPHHAKTIGDNNPKAGILESKSESEAIGKFYSFLTEDLYEKSNRKQNNYKCTYFKQEMNSLMDLIERDKPEWKFSDKFRRKFNSELNELEQLRATIQGEYQKYQIIKERIAQKKNILTNIIENRNVREFGILLYSKSIRVTDYLLSLDIDIKKKCRIYICAGDARGNTIYKNEDGSNIAKELFNEILSDFKGFNDPIPIPDIYVDAIIKQGKIHAVLLGAVALYYGSTNYTHFSNTVGSGLIVDLAANKNIPCIVVAEQSKSLNLYPYPIYEEKREINNFDYHNKDLINNIRAEFEEFELVELKNICLISDQETNPWDNRKRIPKNAFRLFSDELLKDRRKLSLDNEAIPKNANTITKTYLSENERIESDVISKLKEAEIAVPEIIDRGDKSITLKYYKGIRIFNFLVILDSLKNNEYRNESSKINQLDKIAKKLLDRCEEKQKQIQKKLYEQFKDSSISPYPKSKLTNMIDLLFMCFDLETNKKNIQKEIDLVYKKFLINAIVPFRDASTKNMILKCNDLYLGLFENDIKQKEVVKKLFDNGELQGIVEQEKIIDIDFSFCIYYTTPYDDVISFRFHERTEPYYSSYDDLMWNNNISIEPETENETIVATFIVRFLRFGGRKLLYRVIDPNHHAKRFKYDDETYYFKKIPEIIEHYGFAGLLPETIKLFKEIENILREGKKFPIIPYDDENIAKEIKEIVERDTYSDVFPF